MNAQMIYNDETVHPETITDLILHGNSTAKDILDNFNAVPMSAFGQKLANAPSLAEVCRLMHHDYTFAKDLIDSVEWNVVGSPSNDNTQLHVSKGNYIWRTRKLGAATFDVDFDISCSDSNKIIFRIQDVSTAAANGATRQDYRLLVNSGGFIEFQYWLQTANRWNDGSGWAHFDWAKPAVKKLTKTFDYKVADVYHLLLRFDKSDSSVGLAVDSGSFDWSAANSVPVPNKSWRVYLGLQADALIDNFVLTYNSTVVSQLDFT